jgi:folylpolyglutamate synthase/dihydropteroate synthase
LRKRAAALNRHGCGYSTVEKAVKAALAAATPADMVYVGGSMYVLADFLAKWPY